MKARIEVLFTFEALERKTRTTIEFRGVRGADGFHRMEKRTKGAKAFRPFMWSDYAGILSWRETMVFHNGERNVTPIVHVNA